MASRDIGNQDLWLEHDQSGSTVKRPFQLAKDENGNKLWLEGYAPALSPNSPNDAFSYEHVPPSIDLPVSFENWHGGAGYEDASVRIDEAEQDRDAANLASHRYSYSQGVDLSWVDRAYLSPELQTGGATTSGNPVKFVWSDELGLFLMTSRYIMEWTGSAWTERYDNGANGSLTDLYEYSNSNDTYLLVGRADQPYLISSNGEDFTATDEAESTPSVRSESSASAASATSLTLTAPAGIADDDILIAVVAIDASGTITPPSGFTQFNQGQHGGDTVAMFWKRASSESGNYAFSAGASVDWNGWIAAYQNAITTGNPFDATDSTQITAATAFTTSGITTLGDNRRLIIVTEAAGTSTWAPEAGWAERHDDQSQNISIHVSDVEQASEGATGSITVDASASDTGVVMLTALRPPAVSAAGTFDTAFFTTRSDANGEPLLWAIDSKGDARNSGDPTNPASWSAADLIQIGQDASTIAGVATVNNKILVLRSNALLTYDGSDVADVWHPVTLERASDGARPFVWVDNNFYFTFGASLLCYNEGANTIARIWPKKSQIGHPELNGTITAIGGNDRRMFFILKNSSSNYYVMAGDPSTQEFHTMAYLGSNVCNAILVAPADSNSFSTTNSQLVVGEDASADYYILPKPGLRPEDDSACRFDTSQGTVYGPFVDFGAQAYTKFLNRGDIEGDDLDSDDTITLQYQEPGGTATTITTANSDGRTTATEADEVEFTTLRYVGLLDNGANTTTPVLKGFVLHATPNPPRKRLWDFTVLVSYGLQQRGGGLDKHAGPDQRTFLFNTINERVTLYDRDGDSYTVRVLDIEGVGLRDTQQGDTRAYRVTAAEV